VSAAPPVFRNDQDDIRAYLCSVRSHEGECIIRGESQCTKSHGRLNGVHRQPGKKAANIQRGPPVPFQNARSGRAGCGRDVISSRKLHAGMGRAAVYLSDR